MVKKAKQAENSESIEDFEEFFIHADEPVFTTGVVCRLLTIPIWVLKQLDSAGIVSPDRVSTGQSRLYSKRELAKLSKVWYLMNQRKVKVDGIKVILEMETIGYIDYR